MAEVKQHDLLMQANRAGQHKSTKCATLLKSDSYLSTHHHYYRLPFLCIMAEHLNIQPTVADEYSTYLEYLTELIDYGDYLEYSALRDLLIQETQHQSPTPRDTRGNSIRVLALSQDGMVNEKTFQRHANGTGDFTDFKLYLKDSGEVISRIITLDEPIAITGSSRYFNSDSLRIVDLLGLGVSITPWFFHEYCREEQERLRFKNTGNIYLKSVWSTNCNFVSLGSHWLLFLHQ